MWTVEYLKNGILVKYEENGKVIANAVIKLNKNKKVYAENIPIIKQCSENKH